MNNHKLMSSPLLVILLKRIDPTESTKQRVELPEPRWTTTSFASFKPLKNGKKLWEWSDKCLKNPTLD